ncbi:MAG: hypothetical protein IAI50_22035, partial [Candidatus Eremiobacteraeota bacterium]|nr:hypothetical protein [Candidatus Eremiobacteraeota bacterium]
MLRDATESDLDQCLLMTEDRFLYAPPQLAGLRRMWADIIEVSDIPVIVDARDTSRVVHFASRCFVTDERADGFERMLKPKIGYTLAEEFNAVGRPYLDRDAIARANAGRGLNCVVTHYGVAPECYDDADTLEKIRAKSYESGRRSLIGWNLRSFINEVFSRNPQRDGKEMGEALGFPTTHYTQQQLDEAGIPREKEPWLWVA